MRKIKNLLFGAYVYRKVLIYIVIFLTFSSGNILAQPPTASTNIIGPKDICETSSSLISFEAASGTQPFTFVYTVNGGPAFTVTSLPGDTYYNVTHPIGMVGTYTYSLISVQDANYGPIAQVSEDVLTVYSMPTAVAGGSSSPVCPDGGTTNANGTETNGTINWTRGNGRGSISNPDSRTPTYIANIGDAGKLIVLKMTVTSTNVCASQPAAVATYTVPVRNAIVPSFHISSATGCLNSPTEKVSFFATNGASPYTFSYSVNGIANTISTVGTNTIAVLGGITNITGSYVYQLDSVRDTNCSQSVHLLSQSFTVNPLPQARVAGNTEVCQFDPFPTVIFYGSGSVYPYTILYKNNGILDTITVSERDSLIFPVSTSVAGTFTFSLITVYDGNSCYGSVDNNEVKVLVQERPYARFSLSSDRVPNLDAEVTVNDFSIAGTDWFWDFGDGTVSPFRFPEAHTYKDTGTYTIRLKVSAGAACSGITSQNVRVYLPFTLYVPNAFSPNNDGVNDIFLPKADGITLADYSLAIYDRWGNKMFYTDDINKGWDGTINGGSHIVPIDAYAYVINLVAEEDLKTYIYYGSVTSTLR